MTYRDDPPVAREPRGNFTCGCVELYDVKYSVEPGSVVRLSTINGEKVPTAVEDWLATHIEEWLLNHAYEQAECRS